MKNEGDNLLLTYDLENLQFLLVKGHFKGLLQNIDFHHF